MLPVTDRARSARLLFLLALLALPGLMFSGCSSGGGDEEADQGGSSNYAERLDPAKEKMADAKKEAESLDAASLSKRNWDKAISYEEKAGRYEDNNKLKNAVRNYDSAKKYFDKAVADAKKKASSKDAIVKQIADFEKLVKEAEAANVPTADPEGWKYAQAEYKKAKDLFAEGKTSDARRRISNALSDLEAAMGTAKDKIALKGEAEELRQELGEYQKKAEDAKADTLAAIDMVYAKDEMKKGEKEFENFNFDRAISHFDNAKQAFVVALTNAVAVTNAQAGNNTNQNPGAGLDGNNSRGAAPEVGEIEIPDIEEGGDVDLASGLISLFSVNPEYDRGILALEYSLGPDFRKDISVYGKAKDAYMHFEGSDNVGYGVEEYVLAGNTRGLLYLDAGFEDGASLEMEVQFQLVLPDAPTFRLLLMGDGSNCYASDFGRDIWILESKRAPKPYRCMVDEYKPHPSKWIQKRDPYRFKMKYRKVNEDEKGLLQVWINDVETCRLKTNKWRRGKVGLAWNNTKFYINSLTAKGYLDEDWAQEAIASGKTGDGEESEEDFDF